MKKDMRRPIISIFFDVLLQAHALEKCVKMFSTMKTFFKSVYNDVLIQPR